MKRALLVKLGAIGDVVMVLPAAHLLHRQGYQIDWVCGVAVEPLLHCYSWIHPIVAEDSDILKGSFPERMHALAGVWSSLGLCHYDLCATLYYDWRWRIFTLPVRADRRLMLNRSDRSRCIVPSRHHSDEFARILLGWPDERREPSLAPVPPDTLPPSPFARPRSARIMLVPGGASNIVRQQTLRRWPIERYAELAAILLDRGHEVVLLGGPDDLWVHAHFPAHNRLFDAVGTLSLPEAVAVANSCSLVLTHDTGPLHLAGLGRAPIIALFGPTDPGSFLPRRPGVQVLWGGEEMACRPCYDGREFAICPDNGCMQSLALDRVLAAVDRVLSPLHVLEESTV